MKRILFLFTVFFISSSFESGPVKPLIPEPLGPTHPVIVDPNPQPVAPASFTNPDNPGDSFSAVITANSNGFTISLYSPRYIDHVVFTNLYTGETFSDWINQTTSSINSYFNMSNGHWRIEVVTAGGTRYLSDFMVNNPSFGPVVPTDFIDGDYNENPFSGLSGGF